MPLRVRSMPAWALPTPACRIGLLALAALLPVAGPAAAESGYQVIRGTRVFTVIDHAADAATFSNECGSQTISHRDLGNGAIPDRIIPCPRPGATPPATRPTPAPQAAEHDEPGEAPNVAGSYARTCRNCSGEAPGLVCECRRIDQTYARTAIDPDRCAGGEVENLDGRLSCTRGAAVAARSPRVGSPQAARPARWAWVSVAAGIEKFGSRTSLATGYANGRTASEARDGSVAACTKNTQGVSTCRAVGAWNQGCIYIVTSTSDEDNGPVAWGSGPTAQAAYDNCKKQPGVVQCRARAIGGCVE